MRFIATSSYTDGVSVIVPVRNGAPWLARVIEALLAEDPGGRYEIIAIDDGSTDGSAAILARFNRDPRVRVIDGPGRGATAALNLGVALAQCALVAQVDQDVIVERGLARDAAARAAGPESRGGAGLLRHRPVRAAQRARHGAGSGAALRAS